MRLSRAISSIPAIATVILGSGIWYVTGLPLEPFVFGISVAAITLSQIILREGEADTALLINMNKAQVEADERISNEVCEDGDRAE